MPEPCNYVKVTRRWCWSLWKFFRCKVYTETPGFCYSFCDVIRTSRWPWNTTYLGCEGGIAYYFEGSFWGGSGTERDGRRWLKRTTSELERTGDACNCN